VLDIKLIENIAAASNTGSRAFPNSVSRWSDATTSTTIIRNTELLLYEMAAKPAKKIFNLKCKGSTLMMRWRKDRQDIEIITGYIPPSSSDRRIQMPEYEEGEDMETEPKSESSSEPEDTSRERKTYGI
jgi:hypothetical protein